MTLLDPRIEYYVMHEKAWKFGGGEIYAPDGTQIGVMRRKLLSMRAEITLENMDGIPICIINKKLISARPIYDVKLPDENETMIGRAKAAMIAFRGSISMYDANDQPIFKAQGGVTKWNFEIRDPEDKKRIYAVIKKGDKFRDIFAPMFNFKDRYVIHVVDPSVDRLMLLAYAVIIDNTYHDKR